MPRLAAYIAMLATTLFALVAAGPLEINAPSLVQCKPAYLSWEGRYPPFNVTVINDQSGRVLKAFGLREGNNLTWTCDLPGRTEVSVKITDAKGNVNWSNGVWIKNTTDTSCLSTVVDVSSTTGSGGLVTAGNGTTSVNPAGGVGAANATMPAHSSGIGANAAATTSRAASAASQTTALASGSIALVALAAAGLSQLA